MKHMKHIQTFESFVNESLNESLDYRDFEDWLKNMLKAWPFLVQEFKDLKINPKKLTADNCFDILSKKGEVYNDNWMSNGNPLYKAGKYIWVAEYENGSIYFSVSRELSQYGTWYGKSATGNVVKNPHPKIDTSREGT